MTYWIAWIKIVHIKRDFFMVMADDEMVASTLRQCGLKISSIWDLVNTKEIYREAIPLLVEMLPKIDDLGTKEGIVRALTVREASPLAEQPLIAEFRKLLKNPSPRTKFVLWAIANALTVVASKASAGEIITLLALPESGSSRQMLALTVAKLKATDAIPLLVELLADEEVVGHAASALGILKATEAQADLEKLLTHPRPWVRNEAKKAIGKIRG
jgi:HEAT repeat protein